MHDLLPVLNHREVKRCRLPGYHILRKLVDRSVLIVVTIHALPLLGTVYEAFRNGIGIAGLYGFCALHQLMHPMLNGFSILSLST